MFVSGKTLQPVQIFVSKAKNLQGKGAPERGAQHNSIMTFSITFKDHTSKNQVIATFSKTALGITTLNTGCHNGECHLCRVSSMLSVANKPIMLNVVKLNVVAP